MRFFPIVYCAERSGKKFQNYGESRSSINRNVLNLVAQHWTSWQYSKLYLRSFGSPANGKPVFGVQIQFGKFQMYLILISNSKLMASLHGKSRSLGTTAQFAHHYGGAQSSCCRRGMLDLLYRPTLQKVLCPFARLSSTHIDPAPSSTRGRLLALLGYLDLLRVT